MKHRVLLVVAIVLLPVAAWTVSKDFNGRMWLAQVPAAPTSGETAYSQWTDDGHAMLTPGQAFQGVDKGITDVFRDQSAANLASAPNQAQMQQQMSSAQQMMQKYGTPEGQAALKAMTPDQLMALAQQMNPQKAQPGIVSEHDQQLLRKMNNGVYSGRQQVSDDVLKLMKQINDVSTQWDAQSSALSAQESVQESHLPVCSGEAGIPSSASLRELKLQYADKRIALAPTYLPQLASLLDKMRVAVTPEIDFGDDALAAWTQIQDPALKQQVSASAHGAENQGLGDVTTVESVVERISKPAAQAVADKKDIERRFADASGCK